MNNDSETVRDVCAEIDNEHYPTLRDEGGYEYFVGDWARMKADRILSAHEREMAAVVAERDAEIRRRALLERALKPVMNCLHYDVSKATKAMVTYDEGNEEVLGEFFDKDGATVITESEINNIFKAVMEAQRIILEAWDDKNYFWKSASDAKGDEK